MQELVEKPALRRHRDTGPRLVGEPEGRLQARLERRLVRAHGEGCGRPGEVEDGIEGIELIDDCVLVRERSLVVVDLQERGRG
jgi:hypothetical protein